MKIVLLKENLFDEREGFRVGEKKIRAFQGYFEISAKELRETKKTAQLLWEKIFRSSGLRKDFRAHVRFDFVPEFVGNPYPVAGGYHIGDLKIKDIYEVNTHSPECMSCDSLFRENFPEIAKHTPSATKMLARKIKKEYCVKELCLVKGEAVTRDSWMNSLIREFSTEGLFVKTISQEEAKEKTPPFLWRWGNIDFQGEYGEFPKSFQKWLFKKQKEITLFNSVPSRKNDPANKGLLAKNGEIILHTQEDLRKALSLDKDEWVLKPLIGTSGKGIVFGSMVSYKEFHQALKNAKEKGGYGLFRKTLLPKISLNGENLVFTMDFLPSFFVVGEKLEYLYTVVRMEPWNTYRERLAINVLQGGGYGGTVAIAP